MNKSGIYQIRNKINNKRYIGQSYYLNKRKNDHFSALRRKQHDNLYLQNSFNKYGEDAFVFEILEYCDKTKLNTLERYYIKKFKTNQRRFGYNQTDGGDNPPLLTGEKNSHYRHDVHKYEDDICIQYKKGVSINQLSLDYDCNVETIRRILEKHNIDIRGIQTTNKRHDLWERETEICEYYENNHGIHQTAQKFHGSATSIYNILKKNDIHIRGVQEVNNTSGVLYVFKEKTSTGHRWRYDYKDTNKRKGFSSIEAQKLKDKVVNSGYPWIIIDKNKATKNNLL